MSRLVKGHFEIIFIDDERVEGAPDTTFCGRNPHTTATVSGQVYEVHKAFDRLVTVADTIAYPLKTPWRRQR